MKISELVKRLKEYTPTKENLDDLHKILKDSSEEFEQKSFELRITHEWLNRTYSI